MAAMFVIAIEATIVSTAMPQIAGQLGDLHLYAWVFSSFLLTQTATSVVFGKLADTYGRKPVLLAGIAIFLVGSVLCGLAGSMLWLILFRLVQGAGAGAIQPVALTIVGDLYSAAERGKIQGYLASIWGVSSVAGPLAGGLIIQQMSWSWIFWINVPVGLAATAGLLTFYHERVERRRETVDVAGALLFTLSIAALMVTITELGTGAIGTAEAFAALFVLSGVLFVMQERRARAPMLSFAMWSRWPIATANGATLLSGMAIVGLTTFLPMYVQGVLGQTPLVAGLTLTAMVLGWPVGATIAARSFVRLGLRTTLLVGAALMPVGALAFVVLGPGSSPVLAGLGSVVVGLGMGFLSTAAIVIIQDSVGWAERGSATASNMFSRNLGSTLGATVLGGLLNISLAGQDGVSFDGVRRLLDPVAGAAGPAETAVRAALGHSLHLTFWGVFAIAVATLAVSLLVPRVAITVRTAHAD